ncbi:hypothetical protein IKG68_01395 [Candidatus Saccharibacteria bacterium]|nr:hypothetical protein [Candidatus Saccharibacteria bacterium]
MHKVIHTKLNIKNTKLLYILPCIAGVIVLSLTLLYYTTMLSGAKALEKGAEFSILSELKLDITIPSSSVLDITPKAGGQFNETTVPVVVDTNNEFGYNLEMDVIDPITQDPTTSLKRTTFLSDGTTYPTISTLASGGSYTAEQFASSSDTLNKWGYKMTGDNYIPVVSHLDIASTSYNDGAAAYGTHEYDLDFAAKIDSSLPFGDYVTTLRFVLTANVPAENSTSFDLAFKVAGKDKVNGYYAMQDMNQTICGYVYKPESKSDRHESIQLIDKRDNKVYWVTRLVGGECWMTQNLDFDITGGTLTSELTNLVAYGEGPYTTDYGYAKNDTTNVISWTPAATATTIATGRDKTGTNGEINYGTNAGKWANNNNNPYSVDPGEWYQTGTYFSSSVCNDNSWSTGCNFLNSAKNTAYDGTTALSTYFRQTPYADNGTHGAVGNWYNWSAAVAANDTSVITSGTLTNSVCPAGWGLPANGKYGTINTNYNSNAASGALDAGLFSAPLYFVRGGGIYTSGTTTLYNAGRLGFYWSGTTYSADYSYSLIFRSSYVNPANGNGRGVGNSVRCYAL